MNTTPIEKCSIGPDAELTVRLATEKGWSRFLIFPNGNLIGTSPDGIEDEPVPNFGRILAEFRPPGVTHSAPLGRRSFLQIPSPLRVSLKWVGSERVS